MEEKNEEIKSGTVAIKFEIPEETSIVKLYGRQTGLEYKAKRLCLPKLKVFDYREEATFSEFCEGFGTKPQRKYSAKSSSNRIWFLTSSSPMAKLPIVEKYFSSILRKDYIISGFFSAEDDKFRYHFGNIPCSDNQYVAINLKDEDKLETIIRRLENAGATSIIYGRQVDPNKAEEFSIQWKQKQDEKKKKKRTREISDFFELSPNEQRKFLEEKL